MEEFLRRPFAYSLPFSAASLYIDHPKERALLKSRKQAISVMLYIVFFSVVLKAFKHGVDLAPDVLTLDLLSDSDFGRRNISLRSPKIMLGDYLHV
ncbi:MAG: hypothetical protein QXU23_00120 [Candidatus Korarchaeum sp.]